MQAEYQSPESRTAAIEGSYSYTESAGRSLERSQRANRAPSDFFRYRVIKRCLDVSAGADFECRSCCCYWALCRRW